MPQNTHLEAVSAEAGLLSEPARGVPNPELIHERAAELARTLTWLPNSPSSQTFADRTRVLVRDFNSGSARSEIADLRRFPLVVRQWAPCVHGTPEHDCNPQIPNEDRTRAYRGRRNRSPRAGAGGGIS